jgi:hypothetical protein
MLLSVALLVLFVTGFWLYCLTDAILTPAPDCRGLAKPAWLAVISGTFVIGALAWLVVRPPAREAPRPFTSVPPWDPDRLEDEVRNLPGIDAGEAVACDPAARASGVGPAAVPIGPDDDPEFLRALDRAIDGNWQPGGEAW